MSAMKDVLDYIAAAEDHDLSEIIQAVLERYQVLFPQEEVLFLSLPLNDPKEREAVIRWAAELRWPSE